MEFSPGCVFRARFVRTLAGVKLFDEVLILLNHAVQGPAAGDLRQLDEHLARHRLLLVHRLAGAAGLLNDDARRRLACVTDDGAQQTHRHGLAAQADKYRSTDVGILD